MARQDTVFSGRVVLGGTTNLKVCEQRGEGQAPRSFSRCTDFLISRQFLLNLGKLRGFYTSTTSLTASSVQALDFRPRDPHAAGFTLLNVYLKSNNQAMAISSLSAIKDTQKVFPRCRWAARPHALPQPKECSQPPGTPRHSLSS